MKIYIVHTGNEAYDNHSEIVAAFTLPASADILIIRLEAEEKARHYAAELAFERGEINECACKCVPVLSYWVEELELFNSLDEFDAAAAIEAAAEVEAEMQKTVSLMTKRF